MGRPLGLFVGSCDWLVARNSAYGHVERIHEKGGRVKKYGSELRGGASDLQANSMRFSSMVRIYFLETPVDIDISPGSFSQKRGVRHLHFRLSTLVTSSHI